MPGLTCVDASLVLAIVLREAFAPLAVALWDFWADNDVERLVPSLYFAEVTSTIRREVYRRTITADEGEDAFESVMRMRVSHVPATELQEAAWILARQYNRARAYDAQYLAVANGLGCDLWTADRRLVNAVREPWVRFVGDFDPAFPAT